MSDCEVVWTLRRGVVDPPEELGALERERMRLFAVGHPSVSQEIAQLPLRRAQRERDPWLSIGEENDLRKPPERVKRLWRAG